MRLPLRLLTTLLVGASLTLAAPVFASPDCPGKQAKKDKTDDGDDDGFCPKHDKKSSDDKGDGDDDE
jgi:hypothetical protein